MRKQLFANFHRRRWDFIPALLCAVGCQCSSGVGDAFVVTTLDPATGVEGEVTLVTIRGTGFNPVVRVDYRKDGTSELLIDFAARLGILDLTDVVWVDTETLTAVAPGSLAIGTHDLLVTNPDGRPGELLEAFTVTPTPAFCGDGTCDQGENACTCAADCLDNCGDGCCSGSEDPSSCNADCPDVCGDTLCTGAEVAATCAVDCAGCGDGFCVVPENAVICPADCPGVCGDGLCTGPEDPGTCPADCADVCPDTLCTGTENAATCPADCPDICGDTVCTGPETVGSCAADCSVCGDAACTGPETSCTCAGDCGESCGDGCCNGPENFGSCAVDCPNTAPVASDGTLVLDEDSTGSGTLVATDVDLQPLTFSVVANGAIGIATITNPATGAYDYLPNPDANGPDSFTFVANDGLVGSNVGTVSVTVNAVDDPPTVSPIVNHVTYVDVPLQYVFFDADEGGGVDEDPQVLTVASVTSSNQAVVPDGNIVATFADNGPGGTGELTITPAPGQSGAATITVSVSDGNSLGQRSFDLVVLVGTSPPFAFNVGAATARDTAVGLVLRAYDPVAGDPIVSWTIVTPPRSGSLSGTAPNLIYTPVAGFVGRDEFTWTVSDGEESNVAVGTIVVEGDVLFVVGDPAGLPTGDTAVDARLQAMGFVITLLDDNLSLTSDATGRDLVVISSSSISTNVNTKYRDIPEPALTWERFLWDDMEMSATSDLPDSGTLSTDLLDIVFPEHPLAGGYSGLGVQVFNTPANMIWALPTADADVVAQNQSGQPVLFVYETGDNLYGGFVAAGKRVGFMLPDTGLGDLSVDGLALFDAAVGTAIAR